VSGGSAFANLAARNSLAVELQDGTLFTIAPALSIRMLKSAVRFLGDPLPRRTKTT